MLSQLLIFHFRNSNSESQKKLPCFEVPQEFTHVFFQYIYELNFFIFCNCGKIFFKIIILASSKLLCSGVKYIPLLCSQSLELFIMQNQNSTPIKQLTPIALLPVCPQQLPFYFLICMTLTSLQTSFQWNKKYLFFCGWLISLNVFSCFIHAAACVRISFLFKVNQYFIVSVYHVLFIH